MCIYDIYNHFFSSKNIYLSIFFVYKEAYLCIKKNYTIYIFFYDLITKS